MLTHRQRVMKTFEFEPVDRPAFDLMEGEVWGDLFEYFQRKEGCKDVTQVLDYLDTDLRHARAGSEPGGPAPIVPTVMQHLNPPLAHAECKADLDRHAWPDPAGCPPSDYRALRERWPDHALALLAWTPLFWTACDLFGHEKALMMMELDPELFEAYLERQNEVVVAIHERLLDAAQGHIDIYQMGDDFASNDNLMMRPQTWRRLIKPYLADHVARVHRRGMRAQFHSCGAIRDIIPDFIEIGVDCLEVFQTSARGMDPESIARDFGGKIAFYGGIDCQRLLTFGTPDEVQAEVARNVAAFAPCGGYIVANSHWGISPVKGENFEAMCAAARSGAY